MMKKRIIVEKYPGVYIANVKDFGVFLSRIDLSRVRVQAHKVKNSKHVLREGSHEDAKVVSSKLPRAVRRAWEKAQEIVYEHRTLAALYFLIYSLLGVRQTGYLLYWYNTWFIYREQKKDPAITSTQRYYTKCYEGSA